MAATPRIVVLGAGKVGRLVARLLADGGAFGVTVVDRSDEAVARATQDRQGRAIPGVDGRTIDVTDESQIAGALDGATYVASCLPFHCNVAVARAARDRGVHYLDLTEDVATTKAVEDLARESDRAFIPQCGVAPGFITIVAHDLARTFESLDTLKMRVGALPLYPHNRLNYNVTWSTEGLVNEYRHPCQAVVGGELVTLPPLEDLETITIDGLEYEAFNTSGGLGTLAQTYAGKVRHLDYKSMRYPGHRDVLKVLMDDLRLRDDPATLVQLFERALPHTQQDVVIIVVTAMGTREGHFTQESYVKKVRNAEIGGQHWGAIQITTAAGLCGVLELHAQGRLPARGLVRQEDVQLADFLGTRAGRLYA